ncbi:hypothetical protein [Paenibacillus xerothermodurans]|uniref:Uncharacterized protein n=1 Tax=Paenibacillus xerothermodurans TaxID=1977292 RepID=A0A2W1NVX1_PAEXE|nr:hypothetical protein [Paenibacillus xerothermodurans]PZE19832.1 hypothetical protein CBW46_015990 [Paenibacillus xerothermodurans]
MPEKQLRRENIPVIGDAVVTPNADVGARNYDLESNPEVGSPPLAADTTPPRQTEDEHGPASRMENYAEATLHPGGLFDTGETSDRADVLNRGATLNRPDSNAGR